MASGKKQGYLEADGILLTLVQIKVPARSVHRVAITHSLQISSPKIKINLNAPVSPSSSQIIEKIISFWASGTNPSFY